MAGGLNDLELETLEEINLSPQLAARPPPAVPARRARRIVSGVALGVTLTLALITWVSLRVDTPPKARAAPELVSTPPATADVPEVVTPVAVPYGRPHPSSHAAMHAHHRHAHNHTRPHGSPAAAAAEALATKAQSIPVGDLLDPPVSEMATAAEEIPAEAVEVSETATTDTSRAPPPTPRRRRWSADGSAQGGPGRVAAAEVHRHPRVRERWRSQRQ